MTRYNHRHGFLGDASKKALPVVAGVILAATLWAAPLPGQDIAVQAGEMADEGALARGGRLYDKWYKVVGEEEPKETHPAYPAEGKKSGSSTWRCKECHGWDYAGKDGVYAKGSHFTGIKGIRGMDGADPAGIVAVLKDETHGLADMMDERDFQDLALFVSQGQVDMDSYIDRASKTPQGDNAKGLSYFSTICVGCHTADGTQPKDMEKTLGKQMGNPWEVMHKILNGQPGEKMPALRALDRQIVVDIMAHIMTLPKER